MTGHAAVRHGRLPCEVSRRVERGPGCGLRSHRHAHTVGLGGPGPGMYRIYIKSFKNHIKIINKNNKNYVKIIKNQRLFR